MTLGTLISLATRYNRPFPGEDILRRETFGYT
jgi:hypothetical protein